MNTAIWILSWLAALGTPVHQGQVAIDLSAVAVFAIACLRSPWTAWFAAQGERRRVWLGSILLVWLLWGLRVPIAPGLSLHFLLATTLTLLHGAMLGLVAVGIVVAAQCLQSLDWSTAAFTYLCDGLIPIAFIHTWHWLVAQRLPRNYWVLFFVTVFAGSALTFMVTAVAKALLLSLFAPISPGSALGDDFIVLALMGFGEATLNGFLMAPAIIFHPEWVASVDEQTYAARLPP